MDAASRVDRAGVALLVLGAVGWGLNWPIVKLLLAEWPPLFSRGTAGLAAAAALFAVAAAKGETLAVPSGLWGRLGWAASTNVFAFMGFSSLSLLWLTAGEGAMLVYTMPVWATLLAWPMLGETPTARGLSALALCFAGVFLLFGSGLDGLGHGHKWPGVALALAGAVLFALGTVTTKSALGMPPVAGVAWQVTLGCAPMVVYGLLVERPDFAALSTLGFASWAYMAAVPMAVCYLCWFGAIRRLSAATAAVGSLLVPVVGVLAAGPILGEPVGFREIGALALVLAGVALVVTKPAKGVASESGGEGPASAAPDQKPASARAP